MSVADRIKEARQRLGERLGRSVSQAELARLCGWENAQSRIGNYERNIRSARPDDVKAIAQATGFRVEYLMFGTLPKEGYPDMPDSAREVDFRVGREDGRRDAVQPSPDSGLSQANLPTERPVPIISWVQAGDFAEAIDIYEPGDGEGWLSPHKPCSPYSFALRVEGESMIAPHGHRTYPPGTIIFVDPETKADSNTRVVAKNRDGDVTFKEYVIDAGRHYLKPLNPQYETIRMDGEWEIVGVIIGSYFPE